MLDIGFSALFGMYQYLRDRKGLGVGGPTENLQSLFNFSHLNCGFPSPMASNGSVGRIGLQLGMHACTPGLRADT